MKEVGDEFKNRFKKFTGPTEKRFKKINTAELRQFVLEALGEQKAGEKLSDVGDDEDKLVEVAWQVRQAGINGQIILVDEDESDSEEFSSDDSEDSDSKGEQQSPNRGKAAKGKRTRKAREIEVQEPDYSLLMSISWGKNYSSLQVVPKKMQVLQDVKLGPQVYGCAEGDLAEFVLRKAVDALPGEVDLAFRAATGVTWENGTLIHESSSCRVDRTPLEQVEAKIAGRPGSTLIELKELWGEEGVLENFDEWCTNGKNFVPAGRCPHDGSDSQYTLQCACCLHERGLTKLQYEANCGEPDFICADVGMQCMQRICKATLVIFIDTLGKSGQKTQKRKSKPTIEVKVTMHVVRKKTGSNAEWDRKDKADIGIRFDLPGDAESYADGSLQFKGALLQLIHENLRSKLSRCSALEGKGDLDLYFKGGEGSDVVFVGLGHNGPAMQPLLKSSDLFGQDPVKEILKGGKRLKISAALLAASEGSAQQPVGPDRPWKRGDDPAELSQDEFDALLTRCAEDPELSKGEQNRRQVDLQNRKATIIRDMTAALTEASLWPEWLYESSCRALTREYIKNAKHKDLSDMQPFVALTTRAKGLKDASDDEKSAFVADTFKFCDATNPKGIQLQRLERLLPEETLQAFQLLFGPQEGRLQYKALTGDNDEAGAARGGAADATSELAGALATYVAARSRQIDAQAAGAAAPRPQNDSLFTFSCPTPNSPDRMEVIFPNPGETLMDLCSRAFQDYDDFNVDEIESLAIHNATSGRDQTIKPEVAKKRKAEIFSMDSSTFPKRLFHVQRRP